MFEPGLRDRWWECGTKNVNSGGLRATTSWLYVEDWCIGITGIPGLVESA